MFSEDEAESYVHAADGKEEKCGDEREFVNVVGEERRSDTKRKRKKENPHRAQFQRGLATGMKKLLTEPGKSPVGLSQN